MKATLKAFGVAKLNRIQDLSTYKHLTLDVIAISQTTKFLLASCVPYIKFNRASISMEYQRMNFNTQRCCGDRKEHSVS